ncbi:hypothetical protein PQG02_32840 (plasmid) [Nostoc sp. UHCC 0926]|uniref:hypothetical protein n=1 Tax=Nostoc sp. UHCC 0926 TaxID=3025190 RepID=UPI0023622B56|nr:hypothetical protein [Nostoc sp. UHCC 0926]WDD36377.1 hypothetical protein PQG02_32840 [Nostoc sp. UHCC 0926]
MTSPTQTPQPDPSSDQTQTAQTLISTLLGFTPEELQNNPEAAQAAFLNLYTGLKEFVSDSTSKKPAKVKAARARLRSLRKTLQAQGIEVNEEIEKELPKKLQELFSSSKIEQYLQEIVSQLREFTDQIDQSPELVGQKIDEIITSLGKDLFIEQEKPSEEQQNQEYSEKARNAIAQSFKSRGLRSFAGGDFDSETQTPLEDEQQ